MASSSALRADLTVRDGAVRRPAPSRRRRLAPYRFLLPAFVLYAAFMLVPILRAMQLSVYEWDGLTVGTFVGLDNYGAVFTDPQLREAFGHALVLIVFFSLLPVAIGLLLAAVLNRGKVRGLPFFR